MKSTSYTAILRHEPRAASHVPRKLKVEQDQRRLSAKRDRILCEHLGQKLEIG